MLLFSFLGFFSWGHRTCQNQRRGKGIEGIFPLPDQVLWHELSFEKRKDGTFHLEFKASKDEIRGAKGFLESDGTFEMTLKIIAIVILISINIDINVSNPLLSIF